MVLLVLEVAGARYSVPVSRLVEVVPVSVLRPLPGAPLFIAGVFNYHGTVVPIVDLSFLLNGALSRPLFSTRILITTLQPAGVAKPVLLGFMAERATETIECDPAKFQSAGVRESDALYAGDMLVSDGGLIQQLDLGRILTPDLQEQLFAGIPEI